METSNVILSFVAVGALGFHAAVEYLSRARSRARTLECRTCDANG